MKIAIIGTTHPFRGGLASYNERLAKQLQDEGHQVNVYTFTVQYPSFLFPGKTQYSEEPAPNYLNIKRVVNSVNPFNWWSVGNKIKNEQPDVVIVKYWLPFMGPCFGTILRRIKKNKSTKVICIVDNIVPHEKRIGDTSFTKYFVKPVDAFVAMSDTVLQQINLFDQKKPRILSPHPIFDNFGVLKERTDIIRKFGWSEKYKYMLFFGLIRDYKGLDLLLEAFADARFRENNIKLVIAGEFYSDKAPYLSLIEKYQLKEEIIHIDKFIQDSEVADYFNVCDLVVQPYKSATQSGVTQIAYHFNKPMIVTNVGGLPEMCPDGKVGYVVDKKPQEIANAILKFYDYTDKEKMIAFIKEEKKKYSWEILVKNTLSLIK